MEEKLNLIESLTEKIETYGKVSLELNKQRAILKTADIVSSAASRGLAYVFLLIFLAMATIAAALWIGELFGKTYYGFLCVAGFYGIIGTLLYFSFHNLIKTKVNNSIISKTLN